MARVITSALTFQAFHGTSEAMNQLELVKSARSRMPNNQHFGTIVIISDLG